MYQLASWKPGMCGKGVASRDAGVKPTWKYSRRPLTDIPGFQDSRNIFMFYQALNMLVKPDQESSSNLKVLWSGSTGL